MKTQTTYSIDFSGALFLVFLVLKLCGKIDWSWWWVTSPLWIPAAFLFVIGIIYGILSAIINCK